MRRKTTTAIVGLALAAGLGACGGSDADEPAVGNDDATLADDPGDVPGRQVPQVEPIPRTEQTMASGRLSPVNNSGVTGSVNVRGLGERTEIAMNVTGLPAGTARVEAAIVQGSCERTGAEVASVGPLTPDARNVVAGSDTVDLPAETVLNGEHALVVRGERAGPAVPPLACSPLPDWESQAVVP